MMTLLLFLIVIRRMRKKDYIGFKEFLRAKIVHLYSISYGRQSSVLSYDAKMEIKKKWQYNIFVGIIIRFLYILKCMGFEVVKR